MGHEGVAHRVCHGFELLERLCAYLPFDALPLTVHLVEGRRDGFAFHWIFGEEHLYGQEGVCETPARVDAWTEAKRYVPR